jgi:trehalose 6-phosphate phosphatase
VLFIGDDVGDLPAFHVVAQLRASGTPAWTIAVRSDEAPLVAAAADLVVSGPEQVVEVLDAIAR